MRFWPEVRAVLVALHVVAVVSMSVPSPTVMNASVLKKNKDLLKPWQEAMAVVGLAPETTASIVLGGGAALKGVEDAAERIFSPYRDYLGVAQGWRMFATSPARSYKFELWVYEGGAWRRLYTPLDPDARWHAELWEQGRTRGWVRSMARDPDSSFWSGLAESVARRAAREFPTAERIRLDRVTVRLPGPDALASGETVQVSEPQAEIEVALDWLRSAQ